MRYISRTVNAIENLIWYSESTINSLSCTSHQIFAYLSSSGCNFTKKMANFHATFGWSLLNILSTTWKILMQLAQKCDKMDTNQMVWDAQAPTLISQNPSKMALIYGWSNVVIFNSRGSIYIVGTMYLVNALFSRIKSTWTGRAFFLIYYSWYK